MCPVGGWDEVSLLPSPPPFFSLRRFLLFNKSVLMELVAVEVCGSSVVAAFGVDSVVGMFAACASMQHP